MLRHDFDGDGIVTRAEVVQAESQRLRFRARHDPKSPQAEAVILQQIDRSADAGMRADVNKDGRIDWPEMLAFAKREPLRGMPEYEPNYRMIMSFDADGNGAVTVEEADREAERFFGLIDVDKDGTLSRSEVEAFGRQMAPLARPDDILMRAAEKQAQEREAKKKLDCALPKPSDAATILLLDAYGTGVDALSTATIWSQWISTGAGSIDIQPGTGPLYIVVASNGPVIWQLSGAVDRIERLVLAGERTGINESLPEQTPLIGATGVPADRVTILGQAGCMSYLAGPSFARLQAAGEAVRRETGRNPIAIKPRKQIAATALSDELRRFYPGGVVEIDPRTVVASQPVERYEVMPEEAGLMQLERDGSIARNDQGEFMVRRKIRFPAGLHGAHLVRFRIQKGVAMPEGDPGHSCVIVEETGMALYNGATCDMPILGAKK
jgi:Ca2+-binding EF-hand superfamily protein